MSGWGDFEWGDEPWGETLDVGTTAILAAVPLTVRTLYVLFSGSVQAASSLRAGDALNPSTWVVEELDSTGATVRTFTVLEIRNINDFVGFEVRVLQKLSGYLITHRVTVDGLLDHDGAPLAEPRYAYFLGLLEASPFAGRTVRDLTNNPTPRSPAGVLIVNSAGDYETQTGLDLLRKLILRRLTTMPGEFFHLPEYGLGLRVKEPIPGRDLVQFRTEIERQIRREPEVLAAHVSLALRSNGILLIQFSVKTRSFGDDNWSIEAGASN